MKLERELTDAEAKLLMESKKCIKCGHLQALHNKHCCDFCTVPDCECENNWDFE